MLAALRRGRSTCERNRAGFAPAGGQVTAFVFAIASAGYLGFQWTIRLLVYPQFAQVPSQAFVAYAQEHQRRVSFVVGPLFLAQGLSALAVTVAPPDGVPWLLAVAALLSVGGVFAVTGLLAVPMHRRLSTGWDEAAHRRLLRVDAVRLALAAVSVVLACALVMFEERT